MKVLQILPEMNSGGVERGTLEVSNHLCRLGHASIVVANGGRLFGALQSGGAKTIALPVHRKRLSALLLVPKLRRLLVDERPDILHARSRLPAWIAWLAWRGLDPKSRPRFVTTFHGFYSTNAYSRIMTRGERVIAVSDSIRRHLIERYGVPEDRIVLIHRGVDPAAYPRGFAPSEEWLRTWDAEHPELRGKALLLLPGRLTRRKGHEDFVHLIAAARKRGAAVHGLVVGEVSADKRRYLDELQSLASSLGAASDISFLGHRSDVREIMSVSRVVYCLSRIPESFGRTSLESLSLGVPVIATDHGGVAEQLRVIQPEGLVALESPSDLLERTLAFLDRPPQLGRVPEHFSLAHMLDATMEVYRSLVRSEQMPRS